jgi:Helix-hairpin-helix domain
MRQGGAAGSAGLGPVGPFRWSVAEHAGRQPGRSFTGGNGAMASINEGVAALLREYAELLGLAGGDQFRVRSYEKVAKAVGGHPRISARCRSPR